MRVTTRHDKRVTEKHRTGDFFHGACTAEDETKEAIDYLKSLMGKNNGSEEEREEIMGALGDVYGCIACLGSMNYSTSHPDSTGAFLKEADDLAKLLS